MIPQESKLLSILSNNDVTFFIPPYQRNYEWDIDHCKVFMADLEKTVEMNLAGVHAEHFFGTVTFFQTETPFSQPNRLVLIDGQQRITTTMLFLVAMRDISDDEKISSYIDSKLLKNDRVEGDTEYKIKLKQVESDWQTYRDIILAEELSDSEKDSAVFRNYNHFKNTLTEMRQKDPDKFNALIDKGLNKFSVITIELQPEKNSWENPQEIFESMNSLGKPLSLADLVRNYLLLGMDPDKQNDLYSRYWLHIEKTIPQQISNFIRDYMQGVDKRSYPKATETNNKKLYGYFKELLGKIDAEELLRDLSEFSEIYSYIISDRDSGSRVINQCLADIRMIGTTTSYSFLLMLLHEWKYKNTLSEYDVKDILDAMIIFFLRRRIIGITSVENKIMPTLVRYIPELIKADDKKDRFFKVLSSQENSFRLPNDIEVSRMLETLNFYNLKLSKFILSLIEEKMTKCRPDSKDENLQIEHIMPQTLNDPWKEYLGDECEEIHQGLVHNIGNLTLIRHNQELGQKIFEEKKKVYNDNTGLQIAKTEIVNQQKWGKEEIVHRQQWITKYLLEEVIPIPKNMRQTNNFAPKEKAGLSFIDLQLKGLEINFIDDKSAVAKVVGDREVEFEGKRWTLSGLTKELYTRMGKKNVASSYQGSRYWEYDGIRLFDII